MDLNSGYLDFLFLKIFNENGLDLKNLTAFEPIYQLNLGKLNEPLITEIREGDFSEFFVKKSKNIGRFSGAKTFQQARELTDLVYAQDGSRLDFEIYKEQAFKIVEKYNEAWLEAEFNNVVANTQQARGYLEAEQLGATYLRYSATNDGLTRPNHAALDGIILPINDPFWRTHTPPNGWNCRCEAIPVSEFEDDFKQSNQKIVEQKSKLIDNFFEKDPSFAYNPAKIDWVFKEKGSGKHEYFKIPAEYKSASLNNFGL